MYLIYFSYAHCILFLSATTTGSSDMTRFSDCSTTTLAELLLLTNRKNGPIWTQFTVKPSDVCISFSIERNHDLNRLLLNALCGGNAQLLALLSRLVIAVAITVVTRFGFGCGV